MDTCRANTIVIVLLIRKLKSNRISGPGIYQLQTVLNIAIRRKSNRIADQSLRPTVYRQKKRILFFKSNSRMVRRNTILLCMGIKYPAQQHNKTNNSISHQF